MLAFAFQKGYSPALKRHIKTTIGGLILGIIACFFPLTRFFGHYSINTLVEGNYAVGFLFIILFLKVIIVCVSATYDWREGFIIPLFFLGACLGQIIVYFFPDLNAALVMVSCMAAINACITRTPISTIILLSAMTGFHGIIPIMFASLTGFFLAPKTPLIASQLRSVHH